MLWPWLSCVLPSVFDLSDTGNWCVAFVRFSRGRCECNRKCPAAAMRACDYSIGAGYLSATVGRLTAHACTDVALMCLLSTQRRVLVSTLDHELPVHHWGITKRQHTTTAFGVVHGPQCITQEHNTIDRCTRPTAIGSAPRVLPDHAYSHSMTQVF